MPPPTYTYTHTHTHTHIHVSTNTTPTCTHYVHAHIYPHRHPHPHSTHTPTPICTHLQTPIHKCKQRRSRCVKNFIGPIEVTWYWHIILHNAIEGRNTCIKWQMWIFLVHTFIPYGACSDSVQCQCNWRQIKLTPHVWSGTTEMLNC